MSMISAQIDELRELVGDGSMEWVVGPVRASVLREAADTIWQLRDDLQRANAENAKLRELVLDMHKALFSLNLDHCQACPREDACVFVHKSFDCDECAFERDMRELGIEVGE